MTANGAATLDNDLRLWATVRAARLVDRARMTHHLERLGPALSDIRTCCLFIGYPRSGHSLVGSFVDAHPEGLMAHRMDAVKYLQRRLPDRELFALMVRNSERFARTGRSLTGYQYPIDGQWQGRFRTLRVVGDQEGNWTSRRLGTAPGLARELTERDDVPFRFVHVVRNPYDIITTSSRRAKRSLDTSIEQFVEMGAGVSAVKAAIEPSAMLDVYHEDVVADPEGQIRRLTDYLALESDDGFVRACAAVVAPTTHRSRDSLEWRRDQIDDVARHLERWPWFARYSWDGA